MTREEFNLKFRGRMLVFLTEAWACRKHAPTELGRLMDEHAVALRQLLGEMWDALQPEMWDALQPESPPPQEQFAPAQVNGRVKHERPAPEQAVPRDRTGR